MTTNQNLTLLPITQLHHNVGKVFDELSRVGGYTVIRDSKAIAVILPIKPQVKELTTAEKVAKVRALAGGYDLGNLSPAKINKIIDQQYETVLP